VNRILLVEDNPGDVLLIQEALREHKIEHDLQVATDGAEALTVIAQIGMSGSFIHPDLLLLDINLPKADGFEVLRNFRQNPVCAKLPVIVVTSSNIEEDRARMGRLGVTHYFCKPTDLDGLLRLGNLIRNVLGDQENNPSTRRNTVETD
jgi:CheY-like chemotaxis protein